MLKLVSVVLESHNRSTHIRIENIPCTRTGFNAEYKLLLSSLLMIRLVRTMMMKMITTFMITILMSFQLSYLTGW